MTPLVNVDVPMPKTMLDALTLHETYCIASGINTVTHESVYEFLSQRFGDQVANKFKPEYLYQ
jgi:hypothetical protein